MTSNNHTYRLRPGRWSDLAPAARLYQLCFAQDYMVDVHFPNHRENPDEFRQTIHRMYQQRYWTPDYILTCLVDDDDAGRVVGCSWWRRPKDETSALYRWLSPCKSLALLLAVSSTQSPSPSRLFRKSC
jgi:cellulose synthase/poly-beta-1,6-N-acetylglucosamine synthase-like glycosyltransferase